MSYSSQNYRLTKTQIGFYKENGFIKLKEVLSRDEVVLFNNLITDKVKEVNAMEIPLEERDTYGKAFLQLFNLWRADENIGKLIFNKKLAQIATDLMQVEGVRLYHDQALFKEANGGITPWHADQYYWPLSSDKAITAWIPLQNTPLEMGPLEFSAKSQHIISGRELAIGDDSEKIIGQNMRLHDFEHVIEPFDIGEVSYHSGWVFHRAGANTSGETRKVMTIIYMDKNMKLKKPQNSGQLNDWHTWCPGAEINEVIRTHLNPILFERHS